jgi:hypothetical protein
MIRKQCSSANRANRDIDIKACNKSYVLKNVKQSGLALQYASIARNLNVLIK